MTRFGLIGKKLAHSFSKTYFEEKWKKEKLTGNSYELFEIDDINELPELIRVHQLNGLNITVPYKQDALYFLTRKDKSVIKVGAVNMLKIEGNGDIVGFNTDYYGFKTSLENWVPASRIKKCLVLGTGGASKAVYAVFKDLDVTIQLVSRTSSADVISYNELQFIGIRDYTLIVNTTPLGMSPNIDCYPLLPYSQISEDHFLYDLVYNPEVTKFLSMGEQQGAHVKNGLEMLHLQAEKSWEIWTS